jgi:hypothetical protein
MQANPLPTAKRGSIYKREKKEVAIMALIYDEGRVESLLKRKQKCMVFFITWRVTFFS